MNFSRQLIELQTLANKLQRQEVLFKASNFHYELSEFKKFYDTIVGKLKASTIYDTNTLVEERVDQLPELYVDEKIENIFTFKNWLKLLLYALFTPIIIIYSIRNYIYITKKKSELRTIAKLLSSIEALTKFEA